MIITWLLAVATLALLLLVATGVLAALSINSTSNGNASSARNFAIWSAAIGIIGGLILLILFFYYIIAVKPKSAGVIGIAILSLLFLFGAGTLAVFATTSATTPVGDFALWSAIIAFGGALTILVITIFYLYINWFEIASEIYLELAKSVETFRRQQTIQERKIPVYIPQEPLVKTTLAPAVPAKVAQPPPPPPKSDLRYGTFADMSKVTPGGPLAGVTKSTQVVPALQTGVIQPVTRLEIERPVLQSRPVTFAP